ncbi:hypothetical protein BDW62DRAFT_219385 [Aspergillus aurantiobrunneus]
MHSTSDPIIVLAENIAISSLLRSIPAPPSRNRTDFLPASKRRYTLTFDTECKLASTLAFIAHSKDDVDHIPALCLEEDPRSGTLNVKFAVNKASHIDGEDAICRIEEGFERIFAILATVSAESIYDGDIGGQLLTSVVSMCSSRILSRLRLVSSRRTAMKRPFKGSLQEALLAVKIARQKLKDRDLTETAKNFTIRAKEVKGLLDSWSQYQVDKNLVKIVESIHQLQQVQGLSNLIRIIPNQDMSPTSRESLLNIVSKVARYWEAARFLYRTAKKSPLARAMRTVPVRLPKEAYAAPLINGYVPDLQSKIIEATPRGSQQKLLAELCAILDISRQNASDRYAGQVMRTLTKAKVHAEIQLITHCELQSPEASPRVICSSKDACFLCNLCLQLYQKIYTPRSHGRLYPGWRLPCLPQLAELQQRLSQTLRDHFQETCSALLSTRRKAIYPDPNESALLTLPLSRTTAGDSISSGATKAGSRIFPLPESSKSTNDPHTETADLQNEDMPPDSSTSSHHCAKSIETELKYCTLARRSKEHGCLTPGESSEVYRVSSLRPLHIQIEHATGSNTLTYHLEWLGVEEAAEVRERSSLTNVIDAEQLESAVTLRDKHLLYLIVKDTVLKICWASGDAGLSL